MNDHFDDSQTENGTNTATTTARPDNVKQKGAGYHFYRWFGSLLFIVGAIFLFLGGTQWFRAYQSYTVGNVEYSSNNIDVGEPHPIVPTLSEAHQLASNSGQTVNAYFDRKNPGDAALRIGVRRSTWTKLVIGLGGIFAFAISRVFMREK